MDIREQREDDDVRRVIVEAFDRPVVADLADDLLHGPAHVVSLVADDGGVVGHVQLSRSWVDDSARLVPVCVLSPLSVVPARQSEGIGAALLVAALDRAREAGEAYVFLEGDPRYYATRGFGPAGPQGFSPPSTRIPDPAFQVAVLGDRGVRGALVYNDAFWRHDCVGLR